MQNHSKNHFKPSIAACLLPLFLLSSQAVPVAHAQDSTVSSKVEKARTKARLRQKCRLLSRQVAPHLSSTQFMQNTEQQNEEQGARRKKSFLTCLNLSDLKTKFTPSLARLKKALPQNWFAANTRTKVKTASSSLTIKASEKGAKIRVLNIRPTYKDRMKVTPGLYHIRVEKDGFHKWDKWLKVKGSNYVYKVRLKPMLDETGQPGETQNPDNTAAVAKFRYPKRQASPMAEVKTRPSLADLSHVAALKRKQRTAYIKAQVAKKKALKIQREQIALIQKQGNITARPTTDTESYDSSASEQVKFLAQVRKNRIMLERGRKLLKQRRNNQR